MRVNVKTIPKNVNAVPQQFCVCTGKRNRRRRLVEMLGVVLTYGMSEERFNEFLQLVRRVRHDANNPLTAALGHVQLLLDDPAVTDPEVIDSLKVVESELRRLTDILRQLNEIKAG